MKNCAIVEFRGRQVIVCDERFSKEDIQLIYSDKLIVYGLRHGDDTVLPVSIEDHVYVNLWGHVISPYGAIPVLGELNEEEAESLAFVEDKYSLSEALEKLSI